MAQKAVLIETATYQDLVDQINRYLDGDDLIDGTKAISVANMGNVRWVDGYLLTAEYKLIVVFDVLYPIGTIVDDPPENIQRKM